MPLLMNGKTRRIVAPGLNEKGVFMDSNFDGTNMEQWEHAEHSPFDGGNEFSYPNEYTAVGEDYDPEIEAELAFLEIEEAKQRAAQAEKAGLAEEGNSTEVQDREADIQVYEEVGFMSTVETEECAITIGAFPIPREEEEARRIAEQKAEEARCIAEQEAEEARRKAEHEASEAKRKAEWEAKQRAKKEAEEQEMARLNSMSDEEVMAASMQRIGKDTERVTRRNMKECVSEYVQTMCIEDTGFARLAMHPKKSIIHCFQYINRKAREYLEQELKDEGVKMERSQVYGGDIPDDLCYKWAEDYFRDPNAQEDKPEKEEKFEPKPYHSISPSKNSVKKKNKKAQKTQQDKKEAAKKSEEKKTVQNDVEKQAQKEAAGGTQENLMGQMSLMDYIMTGDSERKAS